MLGGFTLTKEEGGSQNAIEQYLTIDTANGGLEGGGKNYHLCKEMCP